MFLWPTWVIGLLVAGLCAGGALLAWVVVHRVLRLGREWAPHPPLHAGMLGLFALMLSFTGSDAWRRGDAAYSALLRESQEVSGMIPLLAALEGSGQAAAADSRRALRDYLDLSLREEWAIHNTGSSAAAGAALDRIRIASAVGLVAGGAAGPAWRTVQDRLDGVAQGRTARLVAGGLYGDMLRWTGLMALYLAAAAAIVCVHIDRPRGVRVALTIFALAATVTLTSIAVVEQPYSGWDAVEPVRIEALLAHLQTLEPITPR